MPDRRREGPGEGLGQSEESAATSQRIGVGSALRGGEDPLYPNLSAIARVSSVLLADEKYGAPAHLWTFRSGTIADRSAVG